MPPVTCYICGRDFGTRSIGIHLPNCEKKWDLEQKKLPKSQRRPVPTAPRNFDKILSGEIKAPKELQEYNDQAFQDFNTKSLEECPNCSRTFLPRPLEIHMRSCKPKLDKKSPPAARKKRSLRKPKEEDSPPRPGTYTKKESPERRSPAAATREDLIELIQKEEAFDSERVRGELMDFMQKLTIRNGRRR